MVSNAQSNQHSVSNHCCSASHFLFCNYCSLHHFSLSSPFVTLSVFTWQYSRQYSRQYLVNLTVNLGDTNNPIQKTQVCVWLLQGCCQGKLQPGDNLVSTSWWPWNWNCNHNVTTFTWLSQGEKLNSLHSIAKVWWVVSCGVGYPYTIWIIMY